MSEKRMLSEDEVFEMISYLVASAQGLLNEPFTKHLKVIL